MLTSLIRRGLDVVSLAVIAGVAIACSSSSSTNAGSPRAIDGIDGGGAGARGGEGGAPAHDPGDAFGTPPPARTVNYTCSKEIHVAITGDDANDGTASRPLRTIARATPLATAGACVKVHAGTYAEATTVTFAGDGSAAQPIVLLSADGRGAAIIDGATNHAGPAVLVKNDYVVVDGFELKNTPLEASLHVIRFDGTYAGKGMGSVLRNCKVTGGFDQLKIYQGTQGVLVESNEFYGPSAGVPISLTGASGLVFRGNYGHDWNSGDNGAIQLAGGSKDAVFVGNLFQDVASSAGALALGDNCGATCDADPDHYAAVNARATNNLFIRVVRAFDVLGCKDCALLSNTIIESGASNVVFKLSSATTNGVSRETTGARFLNNIVTNPRGTTEHIMMINGTSGDRLAMDHNLFWNGPNGVAFGESHPADADSSSIQADPQFVSLQDFRPRPGSPAIEAGMNLAGEVPADYLGVTRPANGGFDIGAFEH